MTNTIAQLWNGTLDPIACLRADNSEIRHLEDLINRHYEKMKESLTEQQWSMVERWRDCTQEHESLLTEQAFCDGYALGTKLTVEALTAAERLI